MSYNLYCKLNVSYLAFSIILFDIFIIFFLTIIPALPIVGLSFYILSSFLNLNQISIFNLFICTFIVHDQTNYDDYFILFLIGNLKLVRVGVRENKHFLLKVVKQ